MTFNEFCRANDVTAEERDALLLFFAVLRLRAVLGIKVYDE